jgi:N-carbamoyl-L-amino-acid hydrolase
MRSDAGVALVRFAADVAAQLVGAGGGVETVWNIGWMTFRPGAANVVPAEAELGLEFRDADPAVLARIDAWLRGRLAEDAALSGEETTRIAPTPMEPHLAGVLEAAAAGQGVPALRMPSGAGHDAMFLARVMPAAMLFVPSIGGISHHWAEDTKEEDLALCCQVLADAAGFAVFDPQLDQRVDAGSAVDRGAALARYLQAKRAVERAIAIRVDRRPWWKLW